MIGEIVRIAILLIVACILTVLVKQYKPELSIGIVLACAVVVMLFCYDWISDAFSQINALIEKGNIDSNYFALALKSLGIAYISSFTAETCRDLGQNSLAAKAEFAGRCAILLLSLPLLESVLDTALELTDV